MIATQPQTILAEQTDQPFRFVLLCHQRSGSNALSAILNDDSRIHLYGQLFNPFAEYRIRNSRNRFGAYAPHPEALQHFGLKPPLRPRLERALLSPFPVHRDLGRFVGNFWARNAASNGGATPSALGFKLHDYQVTDADLTALAAKHADGVVMLWRRNLLKAAVSWGYAIKTDIWSSRKAAAGPPPTHRLDPEEIGWFIEKTAAVVTRWRAVLEASGARWLELTYEDNVVPRTLESLYDFLGVDSTGRLDFRTRRLSRADYAHIANAEELDRRFGDAATGRLFE